MVRLRVASLLLLITDFLRFSCINYHSRCNNFLQSKGNLLIFKICSFELGTILQSFLSFLTQEISILQINFQLTNMEKSAATEVKILDEYEDIDGDAYLQLSSTRKSTLTNEISNLRVSPIDLVDKPTSSKSLSDLVEELKREKEDLALKEKYTKLYEAKTRFYMEKSLIEYRRKKRAEKKAKLAAIEKKKIGIQKLRNSELIKKLLTKSKEGEKDKN